MDDINVDFDSPEARLAMRRRHALLGRRMMAVAAAGLQELEAKAASGQPLNMNAEDARKLYESGAKLERTALGKKAEDGEEIPPASPRKPQ